MATAKRIINAIDDAKIERYVEELLSFEHINLRIRIRFKNRSLLELNESIRIREDKLHFISYRYHFQDHKNRLVFRYDSAPHFPDLQSFPHHKHLPNAVIESKRPSINRLFQELLKIGFSEKK